MKTTDDKLQELKRIINLLLQFSKHFNSVSVELDKEFIIVRWYNPKTNTTGKYHEFDEKEIPINDIDNVISHYKNKLKTALKSRNNGRGCL